MALIVEDGTGLEDAESYVSVADAILLLDSVGEGTSFSAASLVEQEQALRTATAYIDSTYWLRFPGSVVGSIQALEWPRRDAVNTRGFTLDSSVLPIAIEKATALAAAASVDGDLFADEANGALIASEASGLGSGALSESISYVNGKSSKFSDPAIDAALFTVLDTDNTGITVARA